MLKVYKNTGRGYGLAVAIVLAENPEHAQFLTRHIEPPTEVGHIFDLDKWEELDGVVPGYIETQGRIISYDEYWE